MMGAANNRLKSDGGDSAREIRFTHPEIGSDPEGIRIPPCRSLAGALACYERARKRGIEDSLSCKG